MRKKYQFDITNVCINSLIAEFIFRPMLKIACLCVCWATPKSEVAARL